jgi:hypothetical protein
MALTPQVQSSQFSALAASNFNAGNIQVPQFRGLTAINFPSEEIDVSDLEGLVTAKSIVDVQVSAARGLVAAMGRVGQPRVRAWTYTIDGHDKYVLRLGDFSTIVYDTSTGIWSTYTSSSLNFWRVTMGMNWIGGLPLANSYGSNIAILDDTYSTIYMMDPDYPYDDDPELDDTTIRFNRQATAQIPARGRTVIPCWDVFITGDVGHPALTGDEVQLEISDDRGETFTSVGNVAIPEGDYSTEMLWTSLGQITAPGRLFRVTDDGALPRIDDLSINSISEN